MNPALLNTGSLNKMTAKPVNNINEHRTENRSLKNPGSSGANEAFKSNKANSILNQQNDLSSIFNKENKNRQSTDVNEYLKVISRLENKINKGVMKNEDVTNVMHSLDEKIQDLKSPQKNRLMQIDFLKKQGITNLKLFKNKVSDMVNDNLKRNDVFDFLKNPDFMAILLDEPEIATTYAPLANRNMIRPA